MSLAWFGIIILFKRGNSWITAILYATAFGVVPLSHVWHIIHGEGSLTEWAACYDYVWLIDYGCMSDIPDTQYWDMTNGWYEFEGAAINTWEFTVALELFILKLLAASIVYRRGFELGQTVAANFGAILVFDALLSVILFSFSDPFLSHEVLTYIGLLFSTIWLLWALIGLTDDDPWQQIEWIDPEEWIDF